MKERALEVYAAVGHRFETIKVIEYLTVERLERRLSAEDILGPDGMDRYRRPISCIPT